MKKHFKVISALFLSVLIVFYSCLNCYAGSHSGSNNVVVNTWERYYNWILDQNYKSQQWQKQLLRNIYLDVRGWLTNATRIFTNEPFSGEHGGGGHSRDTAVVINEDPVVTPQPITKNYDNSVYNPVTNNYEDILYYYDDSAINYNSASFETTNNFITYEYNYTYYDIVVSPKESPTEGKFFKVYFELPDGRSSFNLTPNDIKGVIFNYDVINYNRTTTDEDVVGIWHLDGDYFNNVTFEDDTSPSNINFVDGRFGGCVLRDPTYTYAYSSIFENQKNNNIRFYIDENNSTALSDWTLEFWAWVPDPSTTLWQDYNGNYYRSYPDKILFKNAPGWTNFCVQSDGKLFINGENHYGGWRHLTTLIKDSSGALSDGSADSWLQIYKLYNIIHINFCYAHYGLGSHTENGLTVNEVPLAWFAIDEVKFTKRILHDTYDSYNVRTEPFDLTFAYTIPDLNRDYSTIAIQSAITVNNSQIGGVRSPNPSEGDVFISLYDGKATSVNQYFNGQWNSIEGAVYFNGEWKDLHQYNFNTLMLEPDDNVNTGGTYIINNYYGGEINNFVDVSGSDITIQIDTSAADPEDVSNFLLAIPAIFAFAGTVLGAICPFLPAWLTALIGLALGSVITLILFVFIRRK